MASKAPVPGARFIALLAPGVALWDVSHLLPKHPKKRYRRRSTARIERTYEHHSGANGRDGYEGLEASARYVTGQRDWPGFAYHYALPRVADLDGDGNLCVYRCQPETIRSYHTGAKANTHGIGVVWMGNLREHMPSAAQYKMAEALHNWLQVRYPSLGASYHSEAGKYGGKPKAACPGPYVTEWLQNWRRR